MDEHLERAGAEERASAPLRVNAGSRWDPEDKRRYLEWEPRPDRCEEPAFVTAREWFRGLNASATEQAIATERAA